MIRRPPRSTQSRSSAASDVYKRQLQVGQTLGDVPEAAPVPWQVTHVSYRLTWISSLTPKTACSSVRVMLTLRSRPVSYTHLRAHETRHDIVCRLLLEKKKTTQTPQQPTMY